jgi:RNA polymerase sigma-70 factor (ECF subfamily)
MIKTMERKEQEWVAIQKARDGDRGAFEELFVSYRPRIKALVESRLGTHLRQAVDVEDLLQETFLRAFESISRFRWQNEGSFFRWLSGIAVNMIRKEASARRHSTLFEDGQVATSGASPSKILRREERFDRLDRALNALSPEHRQVILLARVKGLPVGEIARRMNRSPNAVSLLLLRATRKLRAVFGETESFHLPHRLLESDGDSHDG